MKKICLFLIALLLTFNFSSTVFASSLVLTHIGSLETGGNIYPEWWYTGTRPTLRGTAEASGTVTVSLNEEEDTVNVDESGEWSFYSDSLVEGDHDIVLSSGEESYSFILHLGQSVPAGDTSETTEATNGAVPETGIGQVFALVGGVSSLVLGWYLYSDKKNSLIID